MDKILSIVLIVLVLATLGMLGYSLAIPSATERFSEFYILGVEGKAAGYPKQLAVGKEAELTVGIINREGKTVSYRLEIMMDGDKLGEVGMLVIADGQKWEQKASFTPHKIGEKQKLQFLLYKEAELYSHLDLWVNVAG